MSFVLARPQRIQSLPKPGFLGPGPVAITVWVEVRRFHDNPTAWRSNHHAIDCATNFQLVCQKPIAMTGRNPLVVAEF